MASNSEVEHVETVVVGGSQAGLAVGYHLRQRGQQFVILDECDRVGDAWRHRWDSLRLFTPARYDGLPGMAFTAPPGRYPRKDEVADYLEAYARRFELPVRTDVRVERVTRNGRVFEVTAGPRTISTDNVVVATGASHTPRIPGFADELDPEIMQLHSRDYRHPSQLKEGEVLVVGAGNSGVEISLDVAPTHTTWLSGRHPGQEPTRAGTLPDRLLTPLLWFAATRVLAVTNPLGRKVRDQFLVPPRGIPLGRARQSDLVKAHVQRVPRTARVEGGRPVLDDGRVLDVANVVWCTGFVLDLTWVDLPVLGETGLPMQDRGAVDGEPGLYVLGLPFLHSLSSGLLGGVGRDAAHVAAHITGRMAGVAEEGRRMAESA